MSSIINLSIVFLNYNKLAETKFTCETLQKLCADRNDIEIIAVDNGSEDGTAEFLEKQPDIVTILLPDNGGIAGYAAGFKKSQGKYILVLDDDSSPHELSGIDHAIEMLDQNSDFGIIAAHIQSPNGQAQWSWHLPKSTTLCPSPFFIGCGVIIRRSIFEEMGWYPDNFFLYQNEIDVCFQTRLQGYKIFYDPDFIIVHRGIPNQRPGWRRIFFPTRNTLWLIRRYYPQPFSSYMIVSRIIIGLIRAITFGELSSYFKALKAGLFTPISTTVLPKAIRKDSSVFFRQNSIVHQLLKIT